MTKEAPAPEPAPDLLDRLRARLSPFPLVEGWGIALLEIGPGTARLAMGPSERLRNPVGGFVNGGAQATFADMACAVALSTTFDGAMPFATSDLHIRYLEPAEGRVVAEASVVRRSDRSAVIECRLFTEAGAVALCTCHFTLKRKRS